MRALHVHLHIHIKILIIRVYIYKKQIQVYWYFNLFSVSPPAAFFSLFFSLSSSLSLLHLHSQIYRHLDGHYHPLPTTPCHLVCVCLRVCERIGVGAFVVCIYLHLFRLVSARAPPTPSSDSIQFFNTKLA